MNLFDFGRKKASPDNEVHTISLDKPSVKEEMSTATYTPGGQVRTVDGTLRPPWAMRSDLERDYFDEEWGRHIITESGLLERIALEGFQSGLSWSTVLRKRRAFREVFSLFDATRIAQMTEEQKREALADERLIRNQQKQAAVYTNAEATIALRDDPDLQALPEGHPAEKVLGGVVKRLPAGLPVLIWSFTPAEHERPRHIDDIKSTSPESKAMSTELKRRGFSFVGPTTCYALMQAIGMVDDRVDEED